ncbi:hypothetical protein HDV00_003836 [Rhizophlyctis rosea]|nr:hypothetical protein HDV00_003836 [Rhizophlyctis rosea]
MEDAILRSTEDMESWDSLVKDLAWTVKNLARGRQMFKKDFLEAGLAQVLVKLLNKHWSEVAKYQIACALANILTTDWTLPIPLEDAIPSLLEMCSKSSDSSVRIVPITALRNVLVCGADAARTKLCHSKGFGHLRDAFGSNNTSLCEEASAALRDFARLDHPPKVKSQVSECIPQILQLLSNYKAQSASATFPIPITLIHHLIAIITNITVSTKHTRQIVTAHEIILIPLLFHLLLTPSLHHQQTDSAQMLVLHTDLLATLANLCIDEPSHLLIAGTGLPILLTTLFTSPPQLRLDCMAVLRNLILQNTYCWEELFKADGFVTELVANIPSRRVLLQKYALEITWAYLSKGDETHKRAFYEAECMSALLVPMEETAKLGVENSIENLASTGEDGVIDHASANKTLAGKSFRVLLEYEERIMGLRDPWTRVWNEWKEQDRVRLEERKAARLARKSAKKASRRAKG